MIRSLRFRFVGAMLLLAILAAALGAALTYTHMGNLGADAFERDRVGQVVANERIIELGSQSESWDGLQPAVAKAAADTGFRVVVADFATNEVLADSRSTTSPPKGRRLLVNPRFGAAAVLDDEGRVSDGVAEALGCESRCFAKSAGFSPPVALYIVDEGGTGIPATDPASAVVAALALTAAIAVAATSLSRRLAKPLRDLAEAATEVSAGGTVQRMPEPAVSEISSVTKAFNRMISDLELAETAREDLVADLAHEFRNPIGALVGVLEGVQDELIDVDGELIDTLHSEASHLARLVNDLQGLNNLGVGFISLDRSEIDVTSLVSQTVAVHRSASLAAGVSITTELGPGLSAEIDPARLRQVVTNLVQNAVTHTSPQGQVRVVLESDGGSLVLRVMDNGVGLSKEEQKRVFDRLWRADKARTRNTGGSGIGLSISKAIVEAHGGTISVSSTAGEGSTFTVKLPVKVASATD